MFSSRVLADVAYPDRDVVLMKKNHFFNQAHRNCPA